MSHLDNDSVLPEPYSPNEMSKLISNNIDSLFDEPSDRLRKLLTISFSQLMISSDKYPSVGVLVEAALRHIHSYIESLLENKKAFHTSDVARAVGLLQGVGYPDKCLEDRLARLTQNSKDKA